MNLTEQQKQLLRKMVETYTGGCHEHFIFAETLAQGAALIYPGRPQVAVDAIKSDVLRLRDEDLVDCELNSDGAVHGKPSANGITLVQRNFSEEIPVFPDIKPDSISTSKFFVILDEDLGDEDSVNPLMAQMFHTPEAAFYFFQRDDSPVNPPLQASFARGDIIDARYERLYYKHPKLQRDFIKIAGADIGHFNWDWERAVVEKGPEYARRTLKLSERKRREMETLEKIHLEIVYRQKILEEQNRSHIFLSYASQDHEEAERLQKAIEAAGGTVFLDKKSLEPGDNFAERIRRSSSVLAATKTSLLTLSGPAISAAFISTACLSSAEDTGPFNVTVPCHEAMTLTLRALLDSDLFFTIALRICLVKTRAAAFSFCWSALGGPTLSSLSVLWRAFSCSCP